MKPTIRRFSFFLLASLAVFALAAPLAASTVPIVTDTTPGYCNSSIGNQLNGTSSAFPVEGTDPSLDFPSPPNLTAAQSVLGSWLQNPPTLNSPNWSSTPVTVPLQWAVGTETAIVYRVEVPASGYTGVTMRFGVDNGIFVWLDGVYRGGFIRPGGAIPGEHTFTVGNLTAGTHYIQILREDHSVTNEYTVEITGQAPGPEMNLTGNGTNILDGDNSPRTADHTDFGTAPAGSGTVVRTFTIQNTGELDLHLTGTPVVAVSGANAADFAVTQPPASSVAVGGNTTFQVTFTPPALGNSNATLTIASDDGDENPYDFAITGTGSGVLSADYQDGKEVPLSTHGFTATGSTVNFTLNYPPNDAPVTGTELMVVKNTGPGFINGVFDNLAQGQTVTLSQAGVLYQFVANYYGGTGNDLVLVWKKNRVFGWGYNAHGELGDNTPLQRNAPVPVFSTGVLAGKTVVSVATGLTHSLALCSDGTVASWGNNNEGQLGDNTLATRLVPVAVNTTSGVSALFGKTVVAVAAGGTFSVALCSDGTVATWGGNGVGALGDNTTISRRAPVAVNTASGISALFGKIVVNIASGADHTLALCSDGTLTAWGWNQWGQNGDNTTTQRRVPVVVNATSVLSALRGRSVVAIACGGTHSLALCSDGTLTAWGANSGELGDTSTTNRFLPVAVNAAAGVSALFGKTVDAFAGGGNHSLVLCSDGTVVATGFNAYGQIGDNSTTNRLAMVAVNTTSGDSALFGKTVIAITAGRPHSLALCLDGTLTAWGRNNFGQLGDASTTNRPAPVVVSAAQLASGERFTRLSTGSYPDHTLALVAAPPAPEIDITGNGVSVPDGSNTPSPADHTDFGLAVAGSGTVVRTFTIQNIGDVALNLTATPKVAVSGPAAADFAVTLQPTSPLASGGGSTTFQVTFSPSALGTRNATLSIANDDPNENPYDFAIRGTGDCPPITVTNPGVSTGQAGVAFSQTFTASGGTGTTTFIVNTGTLPTGLTLAANGVLSGTPLQVGSFPITVRATDIDGCLGFGSTYTLVLAHATIAVTNPDTGSGIVGEVFGQAFTQSGGIGALAYSIDSGTLPAGLTLSPEGELYGTPTAIGSYSFTVRVTDSNGSTGLGGTYSIVITGQPRIAIDRPLFTPLTPLVGATSVVAWGSNALGQSDVPAGLTQVRAVSAGGSHTLALKEDGTVIAWGNNSSGQATVPEGLSAIQAISAGATHNLALDSTGSIAAWGSNIYNESNVPAGYYPSQAISAGARYSLAMKYFSPLQSNTLIAWGSGQATPPSSAQFGLRSISAGANHSVVLKRGGTVVAWGSNANGETNVPVGLTGVQAVSAGFYHTLALKSDGTVVAWGDNYDGQTNVPAGLTGVRAISAGSFHSLALKNDGTVVAWGGTSPEHSLGQADVPAGLSRVEALSAGYTHNVVLVRGIPVVAFGTQNVGVTSAPLVFTVNNTGTADLVLGAITKDGANADDFTFTSPASSTITPGGNSYFHVFFNPAGGGPRSAAIHIASNDTNTSSFDIVLTGTGLSSDASLSGLTLSEGTLNPIFAPARTSYSATVSLNTDIITVIPTAADSGTAITVNGGPVSNGITLNPGLNTIAVVVTAQDGLTTKTYTVGVIRGGLPHFTIEQPAGLPLPASRTISAWGADFGVDAIFPAGLSDVKAIATGPYHGLALRDDGTVVAWGVNLSGATDVPIGLSGVQAIAAGGAHSVALKDDGTVVAWGNNSGGQTDVPAGLAGVQPIAAGDFHTVALKDDSTVVVWGSNEYGQTVVPAGLTDVQAIAAGPYHTLALKSDGTVVAWGFNGNGQTSVPPGLTDVQAIAAGFAHSLALKSDGTVVTWGDATAVPAGLTGVQAIAAGSYHSLALKGDGTVVAWGEDNAGQATVPAGLTHVSAISAGGEHSLAIVVGPPVVALGTQSIGTAGAPVTFSIRNTGTSGLTLGTFTKGGSNPDDFDVSAPGGSSISPGDTTTFTISFAPTAVGPRTATLHIPSNDPGASLFDIVLTGSGAYTIIEQWRQFYFGTYENTGTAANTADFDFDGVQNLLEFAFGTDPTSASGMTALSYDGNAIVAGSITTEFIGGIPYAEFIRRADYLTAGLTYTVEFSADLITWEVDATDPSVRATDGILGLEVVALDYPLLSGGAQAHFFKVTVGVAP